MSEFVTKDSGERLKFNSGMQRDIESGKARFDLLMAQDDDYEKCLLTRWAKLLARGAEKYSERNWEQANSTDEFKRFKSSAYRHFIQAMMGETDEDHIAAVLFNLNGMVYLMNKLELNALGEPIKSNNPSFKSFDNKQEIKLNTEDKSFTIYGPGTRMVGKFPGLKAGDQLTFGVCIYSSDKDGLATIELTYPITEKVFLEHEKNWKPKTFGAIKVGSVFNTKVARYYKDSETTGIVVQSAIKTVGDQYEFSNSDEIILISEPK